MESVRAWIAREGRSFAPHVLTEDIYRACHTLAGSSTMAEVRHGIRLAEPINHWLRKSFDSGVGLDDSDLVLLSDCMTAMEMVAGHLDEATGFFVAHDLLRARIARADVELDRRIGEANDLAARSHVDLVVPPLAAGSTVSAPNAGAAVAASVAATVRLQRPTLEAMASSASAQLQSAAPGSSAAEPKIEAEAAASSPVAASAADSAAAADSVDFDPEIAAIFSDEAVELLEAAESALAAWNASPNNAGEVAALRRPLHTLKGGARMAGIGAMGDLAHELESLITRIESGTASGDAGARSVAQEAIDELSRMRELIAAGRPAARVPDLIERIRRGGAAPRPRPRYRRRPHRRPLRRYR